MRKIRKSTFETNSSSTHSITINLKNQITPVKDLDLYIYIGEFGWEYATYSHIVDLLSYLYTAVLLTYDDTKDYKKFREHIEELLKPYNINLKWEEPDLSSGYLQDGYIDHSDEIVDFVKKITSDDELLLRYIFNGVVQTGNDGDEYYIPYNEMLSNDKNYFYYYKGN